MTTKNCCLEENHSSWAQLAIAEAAQGLQVLALQQPTLPSVFKGFPSLSLLFLQFSRSGWQPASRGPQSPSSPLPRSSPPSPLPLTFPKEPASASRPPHPLQLCCGDTDMQTQGLSLPWARQEALPNASKRSAVRN